MNENSKMITKYILSIVFILIGAAVIIRSFYGVGWNDEAYYLVVAQRFAKGDLPLYHEWHPAQWSSIILTPLFAVFHSVTGGTEGVLLFFRLFWAVFTIIEAVLLWRFINKISQSDFCGFISSVIMLIYSTENKALYSYSDMAAHFLILVIMLLWLATENKSKWIVFLAGMCMALVAICNPYTLIIYIWLSLLEIIHVIRKKGNALNWMIFTVGALVLGLPVVIYLFVNAPVGDIFKSLNYMLNIPDHPAQNLFVSTIKWGWYLVKSYTVIGIVIQFAVVIYIIIGIVKGCIDDNKRRIICYGEIILSVIYVVVQYTLMDDKHVVGIAYVPLALTAIVLFLLCKKRDLRQLFLVIVPGLLLSLAFQWGSDTGIYAMMTGTMVSAVIAPVVFNQFIKELDYEDKRIASYTSAILIVLAVVYTFGQRMTYIRPGAYEKKYDVRIDSGVYKGLITDERQREFLSETKESVADILADTDKDANVLVLGDFYNCWIYLEIDRGIGSFFVYRLDSDHPYFDYYYDMHPDKVPEYVYVNEFSKEYKADNITVGKYSYIRTNNKNCYKLDNSL